MAYFFKCPITVSSFNNNFPEVFALYYIKIKHCYGFESIYGHLSKISVKKGQFVKRSQIIGEVGATGTVTGPHLHYTLKKNNHYIDPFDFLFMDYEKGKVSMLGK